MKVHAEVRINSSQFKDGELPVSLIKKELVSAIAKYLYENEVLTIHRMEPNRLKPVQEIKFKVSANVNTLDVLNKVTSLLNGIYGDITTPQSKHTIQKCLELLHEGENFNNNLKQQNEELPKED